MVNIPIPDVLILLAGIIILVKSSQYFVDSSISIAMRFGVSGFYIGSTLMAIGTSIPELGVSLSSALHRDSELIVGNIIGSNIANIAIVIGVLCIITKFTFRRDILRQDLPLFLWIFLLFSIFAYDGNLNPVEGSVLVIIYFMYVLSGGAISRKRENRENVEYKIEGMEEEEEGAKEVEESIKEEEEGAKRSWIEPETKKWTPLFVSFVGISIGSELIVRSVLTLAESLGIATGIMGLLIIAAGTSLAELVVSATAVRKGRHDMALGVIIGSNICNMTMVLGLSTLVIPVAINTELILVPFIVMVGFTILLSMLGIMGLRREITKFDGIAMLALYGIFVFLSL